MSFGKKLGHTLLGLSPLPLSIAVQYMLMIPFFGILFAYCFRLYPDIYSVEFSDKLYDILNSTTFNTVFLLTCAIFIIIFFGGWYFSALAVTTATFAIKAPTRPSRTLTGAIFFGFVTGLPEHCYKAFIYVGIYGRWLGNYENKDV